MSQDAHNETDRGEQNDEVPYMAEGLESIDDFERYSEGTEITVATDEERVSGRVAMTGKTDSLIYIAVDHYEGNPSSRGNSDMLDAGSGSVSEMLLWTVVEPSGYCIMATTVNSDGQIVQYPFGLIAEKRTVSIFGE